MINFIELMKEPVLAAIERCALRINNIVEQFHSKLLH